MNNTVAFNPCFVCPKDGKCSMCELNMYRQGTLSNPQWISVEDRLPEIGVEVIVADNYGDVSTDFRQKDSEAWDKPRKYIIELIEKELFKLADDMSKEYRDAIDDCINTIDAVPTADVVPKSEVERLLCQVNRLKKYDEGRDIKLHARLVAKAKQEVAREIFKEIDYFVTLYKEGYYSEKSLLENIAELKKKYTESNSKQN